MATLLDALFLTKDDFKDFRDISKNISSEKIDAFIREAQTVEARAFLGQQLWLKMQLSWQPLTFDFSDAEYNELWYGVDYINSRSENVRFNGYINAVVYFTYNRFILQQQTNVSRFGVETIQNEISEDISIGQVRSKGKDALQVAFGYQNDASSFLRSRKAVYPEWIENAKKTKNTSFNFFKL